MHDIVLDIGKCRIIARFAESRMIRNDHAKLFGPGFCKFKAVYSAGAVEQHKRVTLPGGVHNGLDAADDQLFAYEFAHCTPPDFRNRGITSSANSVMFFTAFQCGMSAT